MFFQWVTQKAQNKKSEYWPTGVETMTFWLVGVGHQMLYLIWIGLCFGTLQKINKIIKEDSFIQRLKKTNKPGHFFLLTLSFIIIIFCKTTETLIFNVNNNVVPGLL